MVFVNKNVLLYVPLKLAPKVMTASTGSFSATIRVETLADNHNEIVEGVTRLILGLGFNGGVL
jgi:hypothetical protein